MCLCIYVALVYSLYVTIIIIIIINIICCCCLALPAGPAIQVALAAGPVVVGGLSMYHMYMYV